MASSKKTPVQQLTGLAAESLDLAESFVFMPETVRLAREAALDTGASVPSNGACATLTFLARAIAAKAVVEVGTGRGVTGLALFAGMADDGVLTSIDVDADGQNVARQAFVAAKLAPRRFRLINSIALDVLPKLSDGAYDIVLINGNKLEYVEYLSQAQRLLRAGGVLIVSDALWNNLVADPRSEDDAAFIIREALQVVQEDDDYTSLLIPLGDGILTAVKS